MSVLQCGDRLVVSELSRLDRLLGQIIAILDTLAKGERRLRGAEGEHPRRGVRPGPSSAAIPSSTTKTTCRLSAAPAQGGRLPVHAVASAGPTANLARETPSLARGLLERSMNGVWAVAAGTGSASVRSHAREIKRRGNHRRRGHHRVYRPTRIVSRHRSGGGGLWVDTMKRAAAAIESQCFLTGRARGDAIRCQI